MRCTQPNKVWKGFHDNPMTHSEAHYLMTIYDLQKARAADLVTALNIAAPTVSQALKALVFSKQGRVGFILLMGITTLMVALSFMAGFYLLVFFGILGAFDLFTTGKQEYLRQVPLSTYGIVFCTTLYLGLLILLGILAYYMAQSGIEGANIPLLFLSS